MNFISRKPLAIALTVVYGGISLLGHGLHWLSPEHGHHHGLELVSCAVHGSAHDDHHHHHHGDHHHPAAESRGSQQHGDELGIAAGECVAHSHLCEICVFLAQARSECPKLAAGITRPHLVAPMAAAEQSSPSRDSSCSHSPRGPPRIG